MKLSIPDVELVILVMEIWQMGPRRVPVLLLSATDQEQAEPEAGYEQSRQQSRHQS